MGEALRAGTLPERRGYLLNEYTGRREFFLLRGGVLRIRPSPHELDTGSVHLTHGSRVTLLANNVIELSAKVPFAQEFRLAASGEAEAEAWQDALNASIRGAQAKMRKLLDFMEDGCTMHKYNYSNSKRSRRYFWIAEEGEQLCWGRSKGEDTQSVNLRECIGIIFGPMTTTFQRCTNLEDPAWACFSLLFMGRTLDLTVSSDLEVHAWFLGMQYLISLHGIGSMPIMSDAQFLARKVQYKLMAVAHRNGLVVGRYLVERVRAIGMGRGGAALGTLGGSGAGQQAGQLAETAEQLAPQVKAAEKTERSLRKLQQKLAESEAKRASLEERLKSARAVAEVSSGSKKGLSTAEVEACERNQLLEAKLKELEGKLQEAQGRQHHEKEAAKNRQQDEAIAVAERERLHLQQKIEDMVRAGAEAKEAEAMSAHRLAKLQETNKKLSPQIAVLRAAAAGLREGQRRVRSEVQGAKQGFGGEMGRFSDAIVKLAEQAKIMQDKYKEAMADRKRLHNQVLDLKGNIRVFVRVRPINAREAPSEPAGEPTVAFKDDNSIGIYDGQHQRRKWFEFDQVFDPKTTQAAVFEEAKPLATSVLDGYNVCVFAYGQTGSGKTHTMTGTAEDPGLNTNVLRELFRMRGERLNDYEVSISIAITEIYNETIRDLLSPSPKKLDIKMNPDGKCGVPGLTELKVDTVEDVMKCIDDASKNRATSTTDMNEQSSRSHSIVTVRTQCTLKGGDTYMGKIHLIDLAGSENTNRSGVTGQGMKEAQNINKSLSALGGVIQSLVAKNPHTPYRDSKLTMMLKDSLGGDSKTLMIVCSSPAQTNVTETLSSLNFAARARNVELGKAKRNTVVAG